MGWVYNSETGGNEWQDDAPTTSASGALQSLFNMPVPTGALPTAAPQSSPALTPEPVTVSASSPTATNQSGMVNSAHQAAVTDVPAATAEQKAFIDWQLSQSNPYGGGTLADQFAHQGITDPYSSAALLKQAQEQIDRANRRIAMGVDPSQAAEWNDPNWKKYLGTNKEAYNIAAKMYADPTFAAQFAKQNGWDNATANAWALQAYDPYAAAVKTASTPSKLVAGPGGVPNTDVSQILRPGQAITAGEKYSQQYSPDQLTGIRDLWYQYKDDPKSMSTALNQFGFTPDDLGLALGMSKNQVQNYFTGQTVPTAGNQDTTKGLAGINAQQLNAKTAYETLDSPTAHKMWQDWANANGVNSMVSVPGGLPTSTAAFTPWGADHNLSLSEAQALDASYKKMIDDYNAAHPYTPFSLNASGSVNTGRPNDQSIGKSDAPNGVVTPAATSTSKTDDTKFTGFTPLDASKIKFGGQEVQGYDSDGQPITTTYYLDADGNRITMSGEDDGNGSLKPYEYTRQMSVNGTPINATYDADGKFKYALGNEFSQNGHKWMAVYDEKGNITSYSNVDQTGFGDFVKMVAPLALGAAFPGLGTAIGGALGAGATWAPIIGGAIVGGGTAALTGGDVGRGALFGGLGGAGNLQIGDTGVTIGTGLKAVRALDALSNGNVLGALSSVASIPSIGNTEIGDTGITINQAAASANVANALAQNNLPALVGTLTQIAKANTNSASNTPLTPEEQAQVDANRANKAMNSAVTAAQNSTEDDQAAIDARTQQLIGEMEQPTGPLTTATQGSATPSPLETVNVNGQSQPVASNPIDLLPVPGTTPSGQMTIIGKKTPIDLSTVNDATVTPTAPLTVPSIQEQNLPPEVVITAPRNPIDLSTPPPSPVQITQPITVPPLTQATTPTKTTTTSATTTTTTTPQSATVPYVSAGSSTTTGALPGSLQGTSLAAGPTGTQVKLMQDLKQLYPQLANVDPHLLSILSGKVGAQAKSEQPKQEQQAATTQTTSPLSKLMSPTGNRPDALMQAGLSLLGSNGSLAGFAKGGKVKDNLPLSQHVPEFVTGKTGNYVQGAGDGQSDDIPAMLADGEYVFDADIVSALGNGSNKAGARVLDKMREEIRKHKRSASVGKIPPPAKSPLEYMKG